MIIAKLRQIMLNSQKQNLFLSFISIVVNSKKLKQMMERYGRQLRRRQACHSLAFVTELTLRDSLRLCFG